MEGEASHVEEVLEPPPEPEEGGKKYVKRVHVTPMRTMGKRELKLLQNTYDPELHAGRPKTRGECADVPRPCPYVTCRYHLYLDVHPRTGSVTTYHPTKEPDELEESCALDVADGGAVTLQEVGEMLQLSRERIRQIEEKAFGILRRNKTAREVLDAGGFAYAETYDGAYEEAQAEGGSGGEARPSNPDEDYADDIYRVYERTSREREQGIRVHYPRIAKEEDPSETRDVVVQPDLPPPPLEEPMARKVVTELTESEKVVVDGYLKLAKKFDRKPAPREVAELTGIKKKSSGEVSAYVCNALARAQKKGTELPFYKDKSPRPQAEEGTKVRRSASKKTKSARKEREVIVPPPEKPLKRPAAQAADPFKATLVEKRDALQKQIDAIDVLLNL